MSPNERLQDSRAAIKLLGELNKKRHKEDGTNSTDCTLGYDDPCGIRSRVMDYIRTKMMDEFFESSFK